MTVALISEVFYTDDGLERLMQLLGDAKELGADLALLPELALNRWAPATREPSPGDAEPPGGPRAKILSAAARAYRIGLLGGTIIIDPVSGKRFSTALAFDETGLPVGSWQKLHVPQHPGFWEASHYEPGVRLPQVTTAFGMAVGVQICSDANRPEGSHLLGALGAEVILCPRATVEDTFARWKTVLTANALTSCTYVLSVNRPELEMGVPFGGPSIAIDPAGRVVLESTEPVAVVRIERHVVEQAHRDYPGELAIRSRLYAEGWSVVSGKAA
jgi:N-carbamoylputrescine amidase